MDSFQASGEEIERALMDLEPFGLGVSIKEEAPDETLGGPSAHPSHPAPPVNVGGVPENGVGESAEEDGSGSGSGSGKEGADSRAGEEARAPPHAARCVLCRAPLATADGTPKLMECLHSICEPCLKGKIEEKQASSRDFLGAETITIQCPACRLQCQPANMIDQRFVLEKMAVDQAGTGNGSVNGEQQCNSCEETEPATSYCVDCAEFICDNCVHAHQRLKITKDHTIKGKEEAIAELQAAQGSRAPNDMYCREHPQERLSLFCETCDRLTCRDCQLQHHRDHRYQFSTEMAAQARGNIAALLSEVNYKRVLLGSAMKVIRDRQQLIADKKKALVHEITQTVVKLTNAINTRGKQLVLRLNEVCDAKQRTLSEKKDALEQLASITDHCVEFVSSALEHAGDTALLYCKPTVTSHLQRIKSRRADIPNPEIPVRITLSLDKLPDLIRVLSSIGAIVVDGKVDGGAGSGAGGSAQGPYHPPAPAPAPAPPPASPHSAVVALQHAAIHQSFVQSGGSVGGLGAGTPPAIGYLPLGCGAGAGAGGGAAGGGAGGRGRTHTTPLRHALVSSTTHPHHLHGMTELNLRGLLNPQQQQRAPRPHHAAHQAMQAYHQLYAFAAGAGAAAGGAGAAGGRRSGTPRTPSPAPPAYHHHQHQHQQHQHQQQQHQQQLQQLQQHQAKWHIPQHGLSNGGFELNMMSPTGAGAGGSDFKITLGRSHAPPGPPGLGVGVPRAAHPHPPSVVTSTNPKTPSPSLNGGVSLELDKVCAESVQDLMATIAKLDSNGVQVLPEPELEPGPASVHSSTDDTRGKLGGVAALEAARAGAAAGAGGAVVGGGAGAVGGGAASGDPNEDWCAVCMDGGELMCCDKCPKVFHQYCHIPTIEKLPDETESWQCLLCVNFAELPAAGEEGAGAGGLPPRLQKLVERITLELYCQYELSLAFREPVPPDNLHYHATIARPMCLDMIRLRLQPRAVPSVRYSHPAQFVADCRLLFRNAYRFNPPDSQIYKDAKRLEEFFDAQLVKWLPEFAFWSGEGDPPAKRSRLD